MSLLRWQPSQEIHTMRRQLDQAFDQLTHDAVLRSVNSVVRVPAIELSSTADAVVLKAELPGIEAKDIDIEVTRDAVSLKGEYRHETTDEHRQIYRTELRYDSFHRVIPLPVEVSNTDATATFNQGVLTLTMPKLQETLPETVKVAISSVPATPAIESRDPAVKPSMERAEIETDVTLEDAWQ